MEVLAPLGSSWEVAWGAFEMFFRVKTRREWEVIGFSFSLLFLEGDFWL